MKWSAVSKKSKWHYWFAWHPVLIKNQWYWLEIVRRKGTYYNNLIDCGWTYEYMDRGYRN